MSERINHLINRYEDNISSHDCQEWEDQMAEAGVRNTSSLFVKNIKRTKVKTDLIDVDLVRGSTFPKQKTQYDLPSTLWFSLLSCIFFPIKCSWWVKKTNIYVYLIGLAVFLSTILNLILYHQILCPPSDRGHHSYCEQITLQELYEPCLLFIILTFLQCQVVSPTNIFRTIRRRLSPSPRKVSRKSGKRIHRPGSRSSDHLLDRWQERTTSGSDENDDVHHDDEEDICHEASQTSCHSSEDESVVVKDRSDHSGGCTSDHSSLDSGQPDHNDVRKWSVQDSHIVSQIGCIMWAGGDGPAKIQLSPLEIGNIIYQRSKDLPDSVGYAKTGIILAVVISVIPLVFKCVELLELVTRLVISQVDPAVGHNLTDMCWKEANLSREDIVFLSVVITATINRIVLTSSLFFLLAVAERAFKRRFLTAKLFSQITSTRRSMKSKIPHFRLYKVRNIKAWLCVRSFLRRRGPESSIDCIVSVAFLMTLANLSYLCYQLLKDDDVNPEVNVSNCSVLCWSISISIFLIRYMSLASKINTKYRNLSVLLTEQINLYLQMEQKPQKKEQLLLANNVLKLSTDLLKELETPFKIHGLSANPFLYNVTKVIVLSAVSGVLSEMLGFKLKLYKVKLK